MGVTTALVILKRGGIYFGIGLLELLCKVFQVCGTIALGNYPLQKQQLAWLPVCQGISIRYWHGHDRG